MNLLEPRFKVIQDYPYNGRNVGDVIDGIKYNGHLQHLEKYPNIFKRLKWWEERKEDELPKYLKLKANGKVIMVRWDKDEPLEVPNGDESIEFGKCYCIRYCREYFPLIQGHTLNAFLPATKDEYDSFINDHTNAEGEGSVGQKINTNDTTVEES